MNKRFDQLFDDNIEKTEYDIVSRMVLIKSIYFRIIRQIVSFNDFSIEQWTKVEDVLSKEWTKFKKNIMVTVEVKSMPVPKTRARKKQQTVLNSDFIFVSDTSPPRKRRKDRT